ncbi:outer membrane beta-barrel protein [Maribacter sp. CXY002]|uniref:outer membrane beta-barrel protein n=1 Tax=Maribacter luteocoastalis TaxID=3407671 RepID=UPI003B675B5C
MKTFTIFLFLVIFNMALHAQVDRTNFRAGLTAGMTVGDYSEAYGLNLGIDITQHWGVSNELDLGIASGFINAFGEKTTANTGGLTVQTEFDNIQFIPIAGSIRIYPASGFKIGGDVGYGLGVNKGNDGGLLYRPMIGIDMNGGSSELNVSYFAVNDEVTFSSILVGFLFLF